MKVWTFTFYIFTLFTIIEVRFDLATSYCMLLWWVKKHYIGWTSFKNHIKQEHRKIGKRHSCSRFDLSSQATWGARDIDCNPRGEKVCPSCNSSRYHLYRNVFLKVVFIKNTIQKRKYIFFLNCNPRKCEHTFWLLQFHFIRCNYSKIRSGHFPLHVTSQVVIPD